MTDYEKLLIKHSRTVGEFKGTLEGILWWDIPSELKERITVKIQSLEVESNEL